MSAAQRCRKAAPQIRRRRDASSHQGSERMNHRSVWAMTALAAATAAMTTGGNALATEQARLITANGVQIRLSAIERMNCAEMSAKLDEIDATGYRPTPPEPERAADMLLFNYENTLSLNFYRRCLETQAQRSAAQTVFDSGFEATPDR
jgi:hypothetical protein